MRAGRAPRCPPLPRRHVLEDQAAALARLSGREIGGEWVGGPRGELERLLGPLSFYEGPEPPPNPAPAPAEGLLSRLLAAGGGVAELSPRWMVECGVFATEKAAARWIERELPPTTGTFRRRGQRGPHPTKFIASPDCPNPRGVLEARHGELAAYTAPPTKPAPSIRLEIKLHANGARVPPTPPNPLPVEAPATTGSVAPLTRGIIQIEIIGILTA